MFGAKEFGAHNHQTSARRLLAVCKSRSNTRMARDVEAEVEGQRSKTR